LAGHPNARLWIFPGLCGALSASYHELDVVWEDYYGIEEDISKAAVMDINIHVSLISLS
jgi:nucleoside phosphorylase